MNILDLSKATKIPSSRIYKWYDKKRPANPKSADALILQEWLNSSNEKSSNEPSREDLGPSYRQQLWLSKNLDDKIYVPLVSQKARAGYSKSYEVTDYLNELESYQMPPGVKWRGTDWRWFEVGGDSMQPLLHDGDILLCSQVPESDWQSIDPFLIYVIVWKNNVSVKRITIDKGDFILISEDEAENPQKRIAMDDVKEIWKLRRQLNARFPPTKKFKITV